ncbi:hypothetical protein [Vibrio sp. 10N.222.55.B11]|uniref:hypothetical protein n=1 Tax=Vibrio sp. 10N.222.55.B11 TaxID=3229648 RepID=UPI002A6BF4A5|nr:hypothetical protein VCRA2116O372_410010 [Vibrio crassostreae]CAK2511303.1 hypothetical protein VCRA2117O377_410019 [Vibrio crassostreae]CAK2515256.1 hypothetical protein VCRA2116O374_430010 [Vibrio crassostreae]CAK2897811.1 hypothetical protein VCRA2119O384_420020 [Vibrio crassostreae]CAK2915214.1 hypothetical protein VCRA2134O405_350028 [Vibrio crassostreae]
MTTCFLCGKEIMDKKSKEHILGDSFLKLIALKTENFKFNCSALDKEYSRLKVPSHQTCNNEFGSRFESEIINLVYSFDDQQHNLSRLHLNDDNYEIDKLRGTLTKWLAKLYLGFVYWEAGLPRHPNIQYQSQLKHLLEDQTLKLLQSSLSQETPLYLPSSLFYFNLPENDDDNLRFDFATGLPLGLFFIKFKRHLLVVCLGDGNLVTEYFTDDQYLYSQNLINEYKDSDPLAYLHPVSHIWAVRELLPVQPDLEFYSNCILDRSRSRYLDKPEIDELAVNMRARNVFVEHTSRFGTSI